MKSDRPCYWTVIGEGKKPRHLLCKCICGTIREVAKQALKRGSSRSCHCRHKEPSGGHGLSKSRLYYAYNNMKGRCLDVKNVGYARYGGRGILVCDRWLDSFKNFAEDMGPPPSDDHSLERKDNDGNYCPENCVWATKVEQAQNTRNNVRITFNGRTLVRAEWAREIGISDDSLAGRLRRKWPLDKALTIGHRSPTERLSNSVRSRQVTYAGRTQCMTAWARELGVPKASLRVKLNRMGDEAAIRDYLTKQASLSSRRD